MTRTLGRFRLGCVAFSPNTSLKTKNVLASPYPALDCVCFRFTRFSNVRIPTSFEFGALSRTIPAPLCAWREIQISGGKCGGRFERLKEQEPAGLEGDDHDDVLD